MAVFGLETLQMLQGGVGSRYKPITITHKIESPV